MNTNSLVTDKKVWLFVGFGLIILLGLVSRTNVPPKAELPYLGALPHFKMVTQHGEEFSRNNLLGNVWVADFIFTTCAGPCPVMSGQFSQLQERFSNTRDLHLLSITVNPEYDTPLVLKEYGSRYGADHDRWIFLTGNRDEIHRLAVDGFHVGSVEDPVFHSTRFILLDRNAQIRGYYISTEPDQMEELWRDIEAVSIGT